MSHYSIYVLDLIPDVKFSSFSFELAVTHELASGHEQLKSGHEQQAGVCRDGDECGEPQEACKDGEAAHIVRPVRFKYLMNL